MTRPVLIKGERVKIVKFHIEELVNRTGVVLDTRDHWPRHIKVRVPGGEPNLHLDNEPIWFFRRDELEPLALSRSQARREAVQRGTA